MHLSIIHKNENKYLLSSAMDFTIRIWNATTLSQLAICGGVLGHQASEMSSKLSDHIEIKSLVSEQIRITRSN